MAALRVHAGRDRALRRRRRMFGPLTRVLNPLIQRVAGGARTPVFSLVYHQGRRSGRTFATPVGLGSSGAAFLIPLTFGNDSDWCRNVLAAGKCSVKWRGRTYTALEPAVLQDVAVRLELALAFGPFQRLAFKLMGTHTFLRLRVAGRGTVERGSV
jgi:deazaflavin-dependent oxidoreductase (nitroreductase family)